MVRARQQQVDEDAVDLDLLAGTMRRVYLIATGLKPEAVEADAGWSAAAAHADAMFSGGDDAEVNLRWSDFASMLYRASRRAYGDEPKEFAAMPEVERRAWEAAARHAANLLSGGNEALRELAKHENHWADFALPKT